MNPFFKKLFIFCIIAFFPLLILLIGYIYYDPYKVLGDVNNYTHSSVDLNRDYVNTVNFIRNGKQMKYNSFVFGSSRTSAFTAASWKKYLDSNAKVFFFDASGEAIFGIYTKLKYLDKVNAPIDNALILFCRDAIFKHTEDFTELLTIKHPEVSGGSKLYFQYVFFKAYLNLKFLISFYDYTFNKKFKPYMTGYILPNENIFCDPVSNGFNDKPLDNEIAKDPAAYYNKLKNVFYKQREETTDSVQQINEKSLHMLNEIKDILVKHHTKYRIILSPIYDQVKFHPADLAILKNIFGNNLYDFTGRSNITMSKYNWYENKHFRTFVGDSLLHIIYK